MARTRSLKPGFFKNESLCELPYQDRLLFAGLWTIADREGRLEDRPKRIRADIFPYDSQIDIEASLLRLAHSHFIERYQVDGNKYICIPTWKKHQCPHKAEQKSTIQAPYKHHTSTEVAQPSTLPPLYLPPVNRDPVLAPGFSFSDWFEKIWARHPKKTQRSLAESAIADLYTTGKLDLDGFDRVHALWCATQDWMKSNGQFVPRLAEWVDDHGYLYPPRSHSGIEGLPLIGPNGLPEEQ